MAFVKNPILLPLQKLIGISPSPKPVVLDDENISLVLPMVPEITRRSQAHGPTGGWFQGVLECVHSGADDERANINPYEAGASAVPPYPAIIESEFDLWLLGASLIQSSGAAALTGGMLSINVPTHALGWGEDDVSAPVTDSPAIPLALWDALDSTVNAPVGGDLVALTVGAKLVWQPIGIRLPRGAGAGAIALDTTSSGIATFQCLMLIGLFPAALGQDVVA